MYSKISKYSVHKTAVNIFQQVSVVDVVNWDINVSSLIQRYKMRELLFSTLKCERTQTRATLHKDHKIDTYLRYNS